MHHARYQLKASGLRTTVASTDRMRATSTGTISPALTLPMPDIPETLDRSPFARALRYHRGDRGID